MDLPEEERVSALQRRCPDEPEIRREVESLLAHVNGAETCVESHLAPVSALREIPAAPQPGERVGRYRLERHIGTGGMGSVYLASRDDGQFRQTAAVKVVKAGMDSEWAAQRFREERQVLARLVHPQIVRLIDGGATRAGLPYLVMEYVEGRPLVQYCREERIPLPERLRLFLRVCEAVSYAHRNLVIHRDLKPANILVTAEGTPKLLDFGISKLLQSADEDCPQAGSTAVPLMTPEYASPEQVRGDAVTTATDVYSLGVVLYEILTGHCPYTVRSRAAGEIAREVCESEPPPPSAVAGRPLAGDLDNIVLMAMRKDPARRYSSVEHLAEDIRRYLTGRPVGARQDTFTYRVGKFIRRHRAGVMAALLLTLSLLAGALATAWQARRVIVQVTRAERRFVQFRKLANAFLFDFQDRILNLHDLSEARELILNTGIEYIDGLARDAGDDPILLRELGRAYEKIGDIQGFQHEAAMGRPSDALESYRKAVSQLEPLYLAGRANPEATLLLSRSECSLGQMIEFASADLAEAQRWYRKCLGVALRFTSGDPGRREVGAINRAYHLLGDAQLSSGDRTAALDSYSSLLRLLESQHSSLGVAGTVWLADTKRRIGRWYALGGDDAAALVWFQQAYALARRAANAPLSLAARREVLFAHEDLLRHLPRSPGSVLPQAAVIARQMVVLAQKLAAKYPRHPWVSHDLRTALDLRAAALP